MNFLSDDDADQMRKDLSGVMAAVDAIMKMQVLLSDKMDHLIALQSAQMQQDLAQMEKPPGAPDTSTETAV